MREKIKARKNIRLRIAAMQFTNPAVVCQFELEVFIARRTVALHSAPAAVNRYGATVTLVQLAVDALPVGGLAARRVLPEAREPVLRLQRAELTERRRVLDLVALQGCAHTPKACGLRTANGARSSVRSRVGAPQTPM